MAILVIAEHNHHQLLPSTLHTVAAAKKLGGPIDILVAGNACTGAAKEAAGLVSIQHVLVAEDECYTHFIAEAMAPVIVGLAKSYTHILAPSTTFGKNILPRVAALLDVAQITDVIDIIDAHTFKRPIYAGNAIATVQSSDPIKILAIRSTAFPKAEKGGNAPDKPVQSQPTATKSTTAFVKLESSQGKGPDLTNARVVISGGRGLGSAENFHLLERIAAKIGNCAVGASRAAVDAGYCANDLQVGQTGKIVAPELYIAVGISGAIQHLAGMKDSKIIVAINKDENAPIFEIADYGLVMDLFKALQEFEQLLPHA